MLILTLLTVAPFSRNNTPKNKLLNNVKLIVKIHITTILIIIYTINQGKFKFIKYYYLI